VFREANAIARNFTWPIIMSRKTVDGECTAAIGAYTVVNDEGYFLTAFHILKQWQDMLVEKEQTHQLQAAILAVKNDAALSPADKNRALKKLQKPHTNMVDDCSLWLGIDGLEVDVWGGLEQIDLACGKLRNFNPANVKTYPTFKDPIKDYEPGVSVCRLGYPFFSIKPDFDNAIGVFRLPDGSTPPPFFASEGILCRMVAFQPVPGQPQFPFPQCWIETSSPGLRGQSGGPIFDKNGTVWGIQSNTFSYPLGFEPEVKPGQKIHQFLNVGRGVHMATIGGLLKQENVKFSMSAY
jgi:Trypsin-like peptidase domain